MSATLQTSWIEKIKNSIEIPIFTRCCFCFPLRRGLITLAYINLVLSLLMIGLVSSNVAQEVNTGENRPHLPADELPRMIVDFTAMCIEAIMTVVFIVALHLKHVRLMQIYLYFEIVFTVIGFVYSLAFMSAETASELFLILFQLMWQIYLAILIWSSLTKMERDGTVKYVRENENV